MIDQDRIKTLSQLWKNASTGIKATSVEVMIVVKIAVMSAVAASAKNRTHALKIVAELNRDLIRLVEKAFPE